MIIIRVTILPYALDSILNLDGEARSRPISAVASIYTLLRHEVS